MFQHKFSSNTVESLYFELFFLDNNLQLLAVSVAVSVELATSSALYDFTSFCNKKKKKKACYRLSHPLPDALPLSVLQVVDEG